MNIKKLERDQVKGFYKKFKELVMNEFPEYDESIRKYLCTNKRSISESSLIHMIKHNHTLLYTKNKNEITGLLIADSPYAGVSFCLWVMVDQEYQRKGIGTALLKEWENLSLAKGAHGLRLETVERNVGYYNMLGFKVIGLDKNGYCGIDKFLFKKELREPQIENMTRS